MNTKDALWAIYSTARKFSFCLTRPSGTDCFTHCNATQGSTQSLSVILSHTHCGPPAIPLALNNTLRFLHADSQDSDRTWRMPRLVWVFAGRTHRFFVFYPALHFHGCSTVWIRKGISWTINVCLLVSMNKLVSCKTDLAEHFSHICGRAR